MGREDDFTRRVVSIAAAMGIECLCRKMRRVPDEGEDWEPYDEYEARSRIPGGMRLIVLDESLEARSSAITEPLIKKELEHLR